MLALPWSGTGHAAEATSTVYVIPIREEIDTPLTYLVRRGVKAAMDAKADLLVLDMETNGGRIDSTEEIIKSLDQFQGKTVTYVNRKAFSAGAFIALATQSIYMAPESVIGAAAPLLMSPMGGVENISPTVEAKITSAVRALIRTRAEKNGYNVAVVEAMIDKSRELKIDDETLNEKGQILTLTNVQAEKKYNDKPLLSSGTVNSISDLLGQLGYSNAKLVRLEPTGAERLATFLTMIAPLLLVIGIIGIYIEMKTPGFGLPGIIGITAFIFYFAGGFIAGLSGLEWTAVFIIGLGLLMLEIFLFPGTILPGIVGAVLMFVSLIMAMVDIYPGMPAIPSLAQFRLPLTNLLLASFTALVIMAILSRFVLKTPLFYRLVSQTASGVTTVASRSVAQNSKMGEVGVALSPLRPGGKAQFGSEILDVITQGEMIGRGTRVKILGFSGHEAIVEGVA